MTPPATSAAGKIEDRVVLGTWGLSGPDIGMEGPRGYGAIDDAEAEAVLDEAWKVGIRWLDTCHSYGGGRGFARICDWHERHPSRRFDCVLKVGRPLIGGTFQSAVTPEALVAQAEREIDLLGGAGAVLIKDPPAALIDGAQLPELIAALAERFDGLLVGITTHLLAECLALGAAPVRGAVAQIEFHALNRWSAGSCAAHLQRNGWEVWGMQPLAYGFLGKPDRKTFAADDWRSRIPKMARSQMALGAAHFHEALSGDFPQHSIAQIALGYCLQQSALSRVVVGPRSRTQFRDLNAALALARDPGFAAALQGL